MFGLKIVQSDKEDGQTYQMTKVAIIDKEKRTAVSLGRSQIGEVYAMTKDVNGDLYWSGPQKKIRPNVGLGMMIWGGHFTDWIATSDVKEVYVIGQDEESDQILKLKEQVKLENNDCLFVTNNSIYLAREFKLL